MGVSSAPAALDNAPGDSTQGSGLYYIYASSASQQPSQTIKVLSSGSSTDKFVGALKNKVIILSSAPSPTASLDSSDETQSWFQKLDATGSLSLDSSGQQIENFVFTISTPWSLTFSSASDVLLFTFGTSSAAAGGDTGSRIPAPGINSVGDMLTCGLDFTQTDEIDTALKNLFTYAGVGDMIDDLPSAMSDLPVKLQKPTSTDSPKRNALWFVPGADLQTTIRLQFQIPAFNTLQDLLGTSLKGFTVTSADVICKKKTILATTEEGDAPMELGEVAFSIECSVQAGTAGATAVAMAAGLEFLSTGINITFTFLSQNPLTGLLQWLAWLIGDDTLESFVTDALNKEENGTKLLPDFTLRRMTIGLETVTDPETPTLSTIAFDIEVSANFGGGDTASPVVFLLSYNWSNELGGFGTLDGQLWNSKNSQQGFDASKDLDLQPYEENWTILQPLTPSPATSIKIASLIPTQTVINIPDTLPSEITRAYVQFSQDSFAIGGTVSAQPISPGSVPQPYLGQVVLDASFAWGKSSSFTLNVAISAGIEPSVSSGIAKPALLSGSLDYDSSKGTWDLKASLTGLHASTLAEFFDDDDKDHIAPLIESIVIDKLSVEYKYTPASDGPNKGKSKGSSFTIQGDLLIESLKLNLLFTYDSDFHFSAKVNPDNKSATIGQIVNSILGSSDDIDLPEFISDMNLVSNGENAFMIDIERKKTTVKDNTTTSFHFLAQLNIADLHITFAQLHSSDWGATAPSKRLIEVAVNKFPDVKIDVPLIGTLEQPIDELYFLWVQDPSQTSQAANTAGLSRKDLTQLNTSLKDPILVKDKIDPKQQKPTDLLLAAGCHFAAIIHSSTGERSCLLDYNFMRPKAAAASQNPKALPSSEPKSGEPKAGEGEKTTTSSDPKSDEGDDDSGPSAQAPFKKTVGPLSISNLGLKYKDKKLALMFDATFEMGPIGFELIGFSLEAEFTTLDALPSISANIDGLSAAYDKPPLMIAGIIRHANTGGMDYYAGGLIVGWVPYQFEAAGFYGTVTPTDKTKSPFKSIFVFAKIDGPLISLEFAEITGVCGGFGYNSSVRTPTPDQINQFPFVANTSIGGTDDALQVLTQLTDPGPAGWFQPLDSTYWAAVGLKVDAFEMLSIDAVIVVQFGEAVKLGIFALAVADIPSTAAEFKFAHVELGIAAVADFQYGTLKIEAQLSPRSYIYTKDCHLTGGMGLYYWFDAPQADQSLVGDFVFTLGGYHQAFDIPVGYPNPPRLGISWSLSSHLSISGEAYFAITPKACMGGGKLHASFSAGPIEAWFDAFADFLINYKPFHFNAQAGLAVGISFNIDILFIHIHISAEISADLYLWGPPLAGRVHVDFWIFGFNIYFGDSEKGVDPVNLYQFYQLVLQASENSSSPSNALLARTAAADDETPTPAAYPQPPKNEAHNFLAQSGLMNSSDKTERQQDEPWVVRAGTFSFVVSCKMAINAVKNDPSQDPVLTYSDPANGVDIFSKPMQLVKPMQSTLLVQVQQDGESNLDEGWQYDRYMKTVPRALWAQYDKNTDPSGGNNNVQELLNGDKTGLPLMMGVQMTAPKAHMAPDPFPAFDAADASLERILSQRPFPTITNASDTWTPSKPLAGDDIQQQYQAVYNDWVSPGWGTDEEGQQGFVETLAKSLNWDNVDLLKSIAGIPDRLKGGFMQSYVAAPLLTS
ncbi:hypothetical protein PT974_01745 [Cladobotryum mycophilum]|uniref:DUF6603 domain-containing protein n=1 Tax=Cladobotryum mycophilum TaxID=491253 RepID=A0ABR0SXF6_9HYPO